MPQVKPPLAMQSILRRLPPVEPPGERTAMGEVANNSATQSAPNRPPGGAPANSTENAGTPWWQEKIIRPLQQNTAVQHMTVERLVLDAMRNSPHIRALSDRPLIEETAVVNAAADFDIVGFMDSKFTRTSEPVGDLLTTGGPSRFREQDWNYSSGLRKRSKWGGSLEASQQLGYLDNNSRFFFPPNQGNARLTLSFTQPLLNGAGKSYNQSAIVLADVNSAIAWDDFTRQLQDYLVEVSTAYWNLYQNRAAFLQKQRLLEEAREILVELENRRGIDVLKTQVVRARAAVSTRRAELVRAGADILNSESRIRALVYASPQAGPQFAEMIPWQFPDSRIVPISLPDALATAMQNRPEIDQAMLEIRAASVRLNVRKMNCCRSSILSPRPTSPAARRLGDRPGICQSVLPGRARLLGRIDF